MGNIKVNVEKIKSKYFYETEEKVMACPKCKAEYRARKLCLSCSKKTGKKVATVIKTKQHVGSITLDLGKYMCSCVFSSWYRFAGFWKKNYPNSRCRHIKWVMSKIKKYHL